MAILLIFCLSINNFAAIVSDNDGSAFITKSEFEALKYDFAKQIDNYSDSLVNKIDGAIAAYLAGLQLAKKKDLIVEAHSMFNFPLNIGQPNAKWTPTNRHSFQLVNYYVMRPYNNNSGTTGYDAGIASWKVIKEENNRIPIYFVNSKNTSTPSVVGIYNKKIELESMVANGMWTYSLNTGAYQYFTCSPDAVYTMLNNGCYEETNISGSYWRHWRDTGTSGNKYLNQFIKFNGEGFCIDMSMGGYYLMADTSSDVGHTSSSKSSILTTYFSWQGISKANNYLNANDYMEKKFDYVGDKYDNLVFCIDNEKPECRIGWYCKGTSNTTNTEEYETNLSSVTYAGRIRAKLVNASIPDIWPLCKYDYDNYASFKDDTDSAFIKPKLLYYEVYKDNSKSRRYVPMTSGLPLGISSSDGTISVDLEIYMKGPYDETTKKDKITEGIQVYFSKKPFVTYDPADKDLLKSKYKGKEAKIQTIVPGSNGTDSYTFSIDNINKNDEIWLLINKKAEADTIKLNEVKNFAVTTTD